MKLTINQTNQTRTYTHVNKQTHSSVSLFFFLYLYHSFRLSIYRKNESTIICGMIANDSTIHRSFGKWIKQTLQNCCF